MGAPPLEISRYGFSLKHTGNSDQLLEPEIRRYEWRCVEVVYVTWVENVTWEEEPVGMRRL